MKSSKRVFILIVTAVIIMGTLFSIHVKFSMSRFDALRRSIHEMYVAKKAEVGVDTVSPENISRLFPETAGVSGFIEHMYGIAVRYGLQDIIFQHSHVEYLEYGSGRALKALPSSGERPDVLFSYPVIIRFRSDYRGLAEFIREVQNLERLATIETLETRRERDGLSTEMVVSIYSTGEM
jgi:Tfp pilus assembly protein PilO